MRKPQSGREIRLSIALALLAGLFLLFVSCDESGNFPDAHIGSWQLVRSYYAFNNDTSFYSIPGTNTLEFMDDHSFIQVENDWEMTGTWRLSITKLTLRYTGGGDLTYMLEVVDDTLFLRRSSDYSGSMYQYVDEYLRL